MCTANRSSRPWTDFNVSHPRREGPLPGHPFFQLLPNRGNLALDTLHVVDLGVAGLVCGGTLKWLCHHLIVPVDQVWGLAREGCRHIGTANKSRLDALEHWDVRERRRLPAGRPRGRRQGTSCPPSCLPLPGSSFLHQGSKGMCCRPCPASLLCMQSWSHLGPCCA